MEKKQQYSNWKTLSKNRELNQVERARIAERLVQFHESVQDSSPGKCDPSAVIGFFGSLKPRFLGVVASAKQKSEDVVSANLWQVEADAKADYPLMKIPLPLWMRGFKVHALLLDYLNTDSLKKKKEVETRLLNAATSAAVRLLALGGAEFANDKDIAIAAFEAPLLCKRAMLAQFPFYKLDLREEDLVSNQIIRLPDASAEARAAGTNIVFIVQKVMLNEMGTLFALRTLLDNKIQVLIVKYHWLSISEVLQDVVSFDGTVIHLLTSRTDVDRILGCHFKKTTEGPMTRAKEDQLLMDELCWTFPLLFSQGDIERNEFEEWLEDKLECALCGYDAIHNIHDHRKMIHQQARCYPLQLRSGPDAVDLEWFDTGSCSLKSISSHIQKETDVFLFDNARPFTPALNFQGWCVPSSEPDWSVDLQLS